MPDDTDANGLTRRAGHGVWQTRTPRSLRATVIAQSVAIAGCTWSRLRKQDALPHSSDTPSPPSRTCSHQSLGFRAYSGVDEINPALPAVAAAAFAVAAAASALARRAAVHIAHPSAKQRRRCAPFQQSRLGPIRVCIGV